MRNRDLSDVGPPALFVRDGDRFVGTPRTGSAWDPSAQAGGAVLALLGHVLEDVPTLAPMSLTRLTVDIVRPTPRARPLEVTSTVIREGKKVQVVDLDVSCDDVAYARARALRVRDEDLRPHDAPGIPRSTTRADPATLLPPPDELPSVADLPGVAEFLRTGVEFRRSVGREHGVSGIWLRLLVPVVEGEPVRTTSRAAIPMDLVNLIGLDFDPSRFTAINPDVSAHVNRPVEGEWVGLVGNTYVANTVGHGFSMATMSDRTGVFGVTSTSQIVQAAPP